MSADRGPVSGPGGAAGMEFFYSAESIRLALGWPDANPDDRNWASLEPSGHIRLAHARSRAEVAALLLAKYAKLPAEGQTDTLRVLDTLYCGVTADGPNGWYAREASLRQSVAEVFRWTSMAGDPRGTGPLRLWFSAESALLARRGGYANPARNHLEPRGHRDWSAGVPFRSIIRDLADKSREQFERAVTVGTAEATGFITELLSRYASWGGRPRPGAPPLADRGHWKAACASWGRSDPAKAWECADAMLRDTAWRLLSRGRGSPD